MLKIEQPQYLKRTGTVLSPIISGDDFTTTGDGTPANPLTITKANNWINS